MTAATQILWRVQTKASTGNWINRGLYETRDAARAQAAYLRDDKWRNGLQIPNTGYGFGNTRVVRYVKAKKGSK